MSSSPQRISESLAEVAAERSCRAANPPLALAVLAVKRYQHARFRQTYADLHAQDRYRGAAEFFLTDLYGPGDFSDRDAQFARIVPSLQRVFPARIVDTVADLSVLHAVSESLDSRMGSQRLLRFGAGLVVTGAEYGELWRAVGCSDQREQQIALMMRVGQALDQITRNRLLRQTLRLMRGPADAAGMGALQRFLERGFDSFRAMAGAQAFLSTIASRERELAQALFAGAAGPETP